MNETYLSKLKQRMDKIEESVEGLYEVDDNLLLEILREGLTTSSKNTDERYLEDKTCMLMAAQDILEYRKKKKEFCQN